MDKMIILPETIESNYPLGLSGRLGYTYLHGQLDEDCGTDIYSIMEPEKFGFKRKGMGASYIVFDESKYGIYPCTYNDKDCTLFLWGDSSEVRYNGLVVYDDDKESFDYAKICYETKENCF